MGSLHCIRAIPGCDCRLPLAPVNPVLAQGSRTSLTVPHRCHTGIAIVTAEPDLPVCDLKLPQKHRERDPPPGLWVIRPLSSLRLPDVHPQKAGKRGAP